MRRSEAGQTITLVAFGMITFLAAAGLAVDMGYLRYEKRLMQSAADSAALAAAADQYYGNGDAQADALTVASNNGFTNGANNTTVTVALGGSANLANGAAVSTAQVIISQIFPTFFIQVVGNNSNTITATGVAAQGYSEACMVALQVGGIGMVVNAPINAPNCGVVDNGPLSGNGNITSPSIGVFGSDGGYGGAPSSRIATPMAQPAPDPLAYVQSNPPGPGGCDATLMPLTGVAILNPGTFCSGIVINAGAMVTFNNGLYILKGPGLQITGGTATGNNVAFYNMPGSGPITFGASATVNFTASAAGVNPLPGGLLFYQDPANTAAADLSGGGSGTVALSGVLYFPTADLTLAGSVAPADTVVVAQSITINGGFAVTSDSTNAAPSGLFATGSPLQSISLVQ